MMWTPAGSQFKYECCKILLELIFYWTHCFYFIVCSQELERLGLDDTADLYVCEVPVEYQAVQSLLPVLWKEHNPQVWKNSHIILFCMRYYKNQTPGAFCFLWVARGPCWCFRHRHDCHSGAVRPQQRLHTPGQLQLLSSFWVLHGEWPRLYKITTAYGNSLQKSEWVKPRGCSVRVQGCWKVNSKQLQS